MVVEGKIGGTGVGVLVKQGGRRRWRERGEPKAVLMQGKVKM